MPEKKRIRKNKEYTGPGEEQIEKPSKDEIKLAKWMKKNVKVKKTKFLNHNVEYFTACKAIDGIMKSQFAGGNAPFFTSREQVVEFLDIMLEHKFFHRAKKVPITIDELRGTKASKKEEKNEEKTKEKVSKKDTEAEGEASGNNGGNDEARCKKKRKIRLDMHPEQVFVDGSEAYVWIYDPIPIHYWVYGIILLLGAIGICLFPLWPPMLRKGVYYLSLAAAGFLVFILVLTIVRLIVFTIVWVITGGDLHFWIFPNLTEDVGFFASFWPLYESNYAKDEDDSSLKSKKSKTKAKKRDKDSDNENNDEAPDDIPLEAEKIEEIKEHDADIELRLRSNAGSKIKGDTEDESHSASSSANEAPQVSDTKCFNGSESESDGVDYEIISSSEVQNVK